MRHQFSWSIDKKVPIVKSKGLRASRVVAELDHCLPYGSKRSSYARSQPSGMRKLISFSESVLEFRFLTYPNEFNALAECKGV
jgi:hypothetical protein